MCILFYELCSGEGRRGRVVTDGETLAASGGNGKLPYRAINKEYSTHILFAYTYTYIRIHIHIRTSLSPKNNSSGPGTSVEKASSAMSIAAPAAAVISASCMPVYMYVYVHVSVCVCMNILLFFLRGMLRCILACMCVCASSAADKQETHGERPSIGQARSIPPTHIYTKFLEKYTRTSLDSLSL